MHAASRLFLCLAGIALCSAAGLGAYGAHGLAISDAALRSYMTAVDYQFYHGLGLGLVAVLVNLRPDVHAFRAAAWALIIGVVLFCGGIYATTFGAPSGLARIVPLGGIAFMAGWLAVAVGGLVARQRSATDPLA